MKNRDIPVYAVFNFMYIVIASFAARVFSNLAVKIVDLFVELDFLSASIVRLITLFGFSAVLIVLFAYKSGYREARFDKVESVASSSAASLLHFLLGMLFAYTPWLFGATRHLAGFLAFGSNYNDDSRIEEIPFGVLVAVALVGAVLTVVAITVANYVGFRRRLVHRQELTKSET